MSNENWQKKATELGLLDYINNVNLENPAHEKRLYEKFGVDGDDGEIIDQQVALFGFVKNYQFGTSVVHKRQKDIVRMDKESLMEHIKSC